MMERKVVKHANRARGREKSVRRGRLKKAEIEDMKMRGVESYEVGYRRSKEGEIDQGVVGHGAGVVIDLLWNILI